MVDFSLWELNPYRTYGGGNGNKRCMIYDGQPYMVKFFNPKDISTPAGSAFSEHIACNISNFLGIDAQKTILGNYTVDGISYRAVACKDFCGINDKLQEFTAVKNGVIESSEHGKGKDLLGVLIAIDSQELVSPKELKQRFWDVFILDAFIGNFDRHPGNFGIIVNESARSARIAPVYDCGSSLFAGAVDNEALLLKILNDEKEQSYRVFEIPCSAMLDVNRKKINYFDFLSEGRDKDCVDALKRIVPRIDMEQITDFIRNVDGIPDLVKDFYCHMLSLRKEKILDYCYQKSFEFTEDAISSIGSVKDDMLERERVILDEETWGWTGAKRRYAELFRREAKNNSAGSGHHIFNTDIDVHIVSTLLLEGMYSKKEISDALAEASPKAISGQSYLDKVMVKARDNLLQSGVQKVFSR